jgi:hypothetical protein
LDHSSVTSSPRLIAGSYVLHRLLVPRHPPCALTNLTTKMLASTVQFSSYERPPPTTGAYPPPPHHTMVHSTTTQEAAGGSPQDGAKGTQPKPDPSGPNSVPNANPPHPARSHPTPPPQEREPHRDNETSCTRTGRNGRRQLTDVPPSSTLPGTLARGRALDATPKRGPAPDAP